MGLRRPRRTHSLGGVESSASAPDDGATEEFVGHASGGFGRAVSWSYALTAGRSIVTLVVSLILARLLGPEAFGVVAMATVFVLFLDMLVRQGLVAAIVQRPRLTPSHLDTAFWMIAAMMAVLLPVTIGLSGWWAGVNDMPTLGPVIVALSSLLPLKGFGVVPEALIRRRMDFRLLALRTNVAVVVGGVVGVGSALAGAGLWALVLQQVTTSAIELVFIWRMAEWRPRLRASRSCAGELLSFSARSALAAIGNFINMRSDALLIGLFFGPVLVGLYRMAVRFIDLTLEIASGALQAVFLPELSRYATDRERFNARTVEVIHFGALLAIPLLGALAAASEPLVALVGEEWGPVVPTLRVLCILAAVQAMSMFIGPILQAAGRPGILAWLTWTSAVLSAGSFVVAGLLLDGFGVEQQAVLLAAIRTAVFVPTLFVIVLPVLRRTLGLASRRVLAVMWPASAATVLGFLAGVGLLAALSARAPLPPLLGLALAGTSALAVAMGVLLAVDPLARDAAGRILEVARGRGRGTRLGSGRSGSPPS